MKKYIVLFLLGLLGFVSCNDPYEDSTYQVYEIYPASAYLETRSDEFSSWIEIMKYADLYNAVNQASEVFTVFAPDNDAVAKFYQKKNIASIQELGQEFARDLVRFHIIADSVNQETFLLGGKLESRTLSDDYLTVTPGDNGIKSLYINNEALVLEMALAVSNGYVYTLDAVLSPLVETVWERVAEQNEYSLFRQLLEATTWKDSVHTIYDTVYNQNGSTRQQKRNYTLMAVPDAVFQAEGIHTVADLAEKLEASSENYGDKENEVFLYTAYHIVQGNYSLFELKSFEGSAKKRLWGTLSENVFEISEEDDRQFYLNHAGGEDKRAQFMENYSDVQAKNGMLHRIDGILPIWESIIPVQVMWDFTNYPEVASYITTNGTTGQTYQAAATAEFRTEITHLACYEVYKSPSGTKNPDYNSVDYFTVKLAGSNWIKCQYADQLILNLGYTGSITMKSPAVIAGKYKVVLGVCYASSMDFMRKMTDGSNGGMLEFSFDGGDHKKSFAPIPSITANTLDLYDYVVYEELEFTKTGTHTLKIVIQDPAASTHNKFRIQLDYLKFEPIIDEEE